LIVVLDCEFSNL